MGGAKIYPSKGRTLIKQDGKTFKFINGRCHKAHLLKRNPRKVTWTVLYRRKHRKGIEEETAKKRTKDAEVPARRGGRHAVRHPGQAKPEAGGQEGAEGAGHPGGEGDEEDDKEHE